MLSQVGKFDGKSIADLSGEGETPSEGISVKSVERE